jgi:hypothetical protein
MIKILNKNLIILKMIPLASKNVKVMSKKAIQSYYLINKLQKLYEKAIFLKDSSKITMLLKIKMKI